MKNLSRRFLAVLLLIAMLVPFVAVKADATEQEPVVQNTRSETNPLYPEIHYSEPLAAPEASDEAIPKDLTYHTTLASAGADVRKQLKNRQATVEVGIKTTNSNSDYWYQLFEDLITEAMKHTGVPTEGDYIQWQWGRWSAYYNYDYSGGYYYVYYNYSFEYYTTAAQEQQMNTAVANVLKQLNLSGKSDYQKVRAIYDYICDNVVYDYANLYVDSYKLKYTGYAALLNGTAVCQGYTLLFYRLALESGVDSRAIPSILSENHIWNIVELGGLYYNLDSTWDAGMNPNYDYFLRCDANFYGHTRDAEYRTSAFYAEYPMSPVDYDPNNITVTVPNKPYKIVNVVSGVHVYWNAVSGANKYGVWRSETGADGTYKWIANPTTNHFTDTTVKSGKTYHYKITAMNPNTGEHTAKSASLGITYVATPDITARYNKAAGIKLEWQKITGATGYAVYRKSYSGNDDWVRVATISGNSTLTWTDTSVKNENGTVYKYTIRALAGSNKSTLSGCRSAGRTMVRLLSRSITSVSKPAAGSIKVTWTTSSAVTGYEIRFIANGKVVDTVTVTSYKTGVKTVSGLKSGVEYQVQVRAYKTVPGVGSFYSAWSTAKYQFA